MLVAFPLHHVVLRLAEKSVLRTKKCNKTEKIVVASLQNSRRVFKLGRHRCQMEQGTDAGPAKFLRPKLVQMVKWKQNRHE